MGKFAFVKAEKLNKEKWIKELFEKGSSFNLYPFRILYYPHPEPDYPLNQLLITVSVRNFKRAVDRNLLKRRIREAWRLNRAGFSAEPKLLIAYIYSAREIEDYSKIEASLIKSFEGIAAKKTHVKSGRNRPGNEPKTAAGV